MKQIKIPFLGEFRDRLLSGRKTLTSRTSKYGEPDDWFDIFGARFQLIQVFEATLQQVCIMGWYSEGLDNCGEFVGVWNRLHPKVGYKPEQTVFVHYFQRIH